MSDELKITADSYPKAYTALDDLERELISPYSTERLEYVLKTLDEAEELNGNLCWKTAIWEGCTIEELLGGLIEAEYLLERSRETEGGNSDQSDFRERHKDGNQQ